MRRTVGWTAIAFLVLTTSCSRPSAVVSTLGNASAPASGDTSAPMAAPSAFVTVTPVPVASGASTNASTVEPTPFRIGALPLSSGPDEPTTSGMRLSYSLDTPGFAPSHEVWVVTSVQRGSGSTHVVLQEQVGRTPGLNHAIDIMPNGALQFDSYDVGFRNGAQLTRTSGAIEVAAPAVLTTTSSTFDATYTEAGNPTQLTVSADVQRLGAQRIMVPAGTYDADVIREDVSWDADGSHDQINYLLYLVPAIGVVHEVEQWSTNRGPLRNIGTLALTSITDGP
jgi:hypothetical protein